MLKKSWSDFYLLLLNLFIRVLSAPIHVFTFFLFS
jgi:hypothetical protein